MNHDIYTYKSKIIFFGFLAESEKPYPPPVTTTPLPRIIPDKESTAGFVSIKNHDPKEIINILK